MDINTLQLYKSVRESMTDIEASDKEVSGFVEFDADLIDKLKQLNEDKLCSASFHIYKDDGKDFSVTVDTEITARHYELCKKAKIELSIQSNQNNDYFICSDWSDLTSYSAYLLTPVKGVYLSSTKEILTEENPGDTFEAYLNMSRICNLITAVAHTKSGDTYTILCGHPLDISLSVNSSVFDADINISFLDTLLGKDLHQEAMNSLVREALYNLVSDLDVNSRLSHLINHFNAFIEKLLVSYGQYVKNYSFDKVRREYKEKSTEYTSRLNKVFDDVAIKTFSIPLGVWFAISKMETTPSIDTLQFLKNVSYSFMVFFLVFVVCLSLIGQFSTLTKTAEEYNDLFDRLNDELESIQQSELRVLRQGFDTRLVVIWYKLAGTLLLAIILFAFTAFTAFTAVV